MLRITKSQSSTAAKRYFDDALRISDYYHDGAKTLGRWHGKAAARLGLSGEVTRRAFFKVLENRHPLSGKRITQRALKNVGIDFTFNCPKSVSLIWLATQDIRIEAAVRRAVRETMAEVERDMQTRVRKGSKAFSMDNRRTGEMVWAEFLHNSTRPVEGLPDPHLHVHAYAMNMTWDPVERRFKAAEVGDIVADRVYYEAAFLARLSRGMVKLGYEIERQGKWWTVRGVSRTLIDKFSRRSAEIEAAAEARGITDAERKGELGARTRSRKRNEIVGAEWRAAALARLLPGERLELDKVIGDAQADGSNGVKTTVREAARYALQSGFERQSVCNEKRVLASALARGFDSGVVPEELRSEIARAGVISKEVQGRKYISTKEILAEEQKIIEFARAGRLTRAPLNDSPTPPDAAFLNDQQRRAISHILSCKDRLTIVRGGAGTGKTTIMSECARGIAEGGHKLFVFAPTNAAVDVLRDDGFKSAASLRSLVDHGRVAEEIGRNAVIWVDEAGLISTRDLAKLCDLASDNNWRIILSGDIAQHGAVERGDALRVLQERSGIRPAQINEIVRQRGVYRDAVAAIEGGDLAQGWSLLESMGSIIELSGDERIRALAGDYLGELDAGRTALVVAPTHREKDAITAEIRAGLKAHERLSRDEHVTSTLRDLRWTEAERSDLAQYREGLVVKFYQNAPGNIPRGNVYTVGGIADGAVFLHDESGAEKRLPLQSSASFRVFERRDISISNGEVVRITDNARTLEGGKISNGTIVTVKHVTGDGVLELSDGRRLSADFGHLDYGYTATSYVSQGRTVDTVLVGMSADSSPAITREQLYVSVSRGRNGVRVYVDEKDQVVAAASRSSARVSAHDLLDGDLRARIDPKRSERLSRHVETVNRHVARLAKSVLADTARDPAMLKQARQLAFAEYKGRVQDNASQLGE